VKVCSGAAAAAAAAGLRVFASTRSLFVPTRRFSRSRFDRFSPFALDDGCTPSRIAPA